MNNFLLRGLWASVMATSSMTLAMFQRFMRLPAKEQKALPPAQLTEELSRKTGISDNMTRETQSQATLISHYGYGATCGVLYAMLASHIPGPALLKGSLLGIGVWAASYYGLIPGLGLKPSADRLSKERNAMMFAAHIVWGASLGYSEELLRKRGLQMLSAKDRALS